MCDEINNLDPIKHLADSIGHTPESVIILDAVVDYAIKVDTASAELNQVLHDILSKMDVADLSPELRDWLEQRKGMLDDVNEIDGDATS